MTNVPIIAIFQVMLPVALKPVSLLAGNKTVIITFIKPVILIPNSRHATSGANNMVFPSCTVDRYWYNRLIQIILQLLSLFCLLGTTMGCSPASVTPENIEAWVHHREWSEMFI